MSGFTANYKGKIVVITGGSKGIGLACAKQFIVHDARVFICSRSQDNVDQALKELPGAIGFSADLSNENQANDLVKRITKDFGPIDVLVNSAGAAKRTPVAELKTESWRAAMDAKFFSTINVLARYQINGCPGQGCDHKYYWSWGTGCQPYALSGWCCKFCFNACYCGAW